MPGDGERQDRDHRKARDQGYRDRLESMKRVRKELGLSTPDSHLEKVARERTERAMKRAIRDEG